MQSPAPRREGALVKSRKRLLQKGYTFSHCRVSPMCEVVHPDGGMDVSQKGGLKQ